MTVPSALMPVASLSTLQPSASGSTPAGGEQHVPQALRAAGRRPVEGFEAGGGGAPPGDGGAVGAGGQGEGVERAAGQVAQAEHAGGGGPAVGLVARGAAGAADDDRAVVVRFFSATG